MAIGVRHQFVGALGGGIELQRMVGRLVFGKGQPGVGTIHARGARIDEVRVRVGGAAAFQYIDEGVDVAAHVGARVLQRVAHARLGRQMDDRVEPVRGEAGFQHFALGQIRPVERVRRAGTRGRGFELAQPRVLERGS